MDIGHQRVGAPWPRPAAFTSYSSRVAWNLWANLAPRRDGGQAIDAALVQAMADLHSFLAALYTDMYQDPAAWKLPVRPIRLEDGRAQITAPRAKMEASFRALWALGQMIEEADGRCTVPTETWRGWLQANKGKLVAPFFQRLPLVGLQLRGDETLEVTSSTCPHMPLALSRLAKATAQDRKSGLYHFLRCDQRALDGDFRWTLDDALVSLDERDAAVGRRLDAYVRDLGCRTELLPPTLWWGEYRARYTHRQTGRALYGFAIQEGALAIRAICDSSKAILPTVLSEPQPVREWFLAICACFECGNCKDGPMEIEQDGRTWRLCSGAYANDQPPPYEHIDGVERIIAAQLDLLRRKREQRGAVKRRRRGAKDAAE
jgi:hypothetical protein